MVGGIGTDLLLLDGLGSDKYHPLLSLTNERCIYILPSLISFHLRPNASPGHIPDVISNKNKGYHLSSSADFRNL